MKSQAMMKRWIENIKTLKTPVIRINQLRMKEVSIMRQPRTKPTKMSPQLPRKQPQLKQTSKQLRQPVKKERNKLTKKRKNKTKKKKSNWNKIAKTKILLKARNGLKTEKRKQKMPTQLLNFNTKCKKQFRETTVTKKRKNSTPTKKHPGIETQNLIGNLEKRKTKRTTNY